MTRWRLPWFWRGTPCRQRSRGDSEPATKLEGTPSRHLVHQNHPNVAHFCRCINRPLAPMPFGYSVRGQCRMERRRARWLCNPKGIVSSSPGLPSPRGYPGLASVRFSTPTVVSHLRHRATTPWGWPTPPAFPRVARGSQPFGAESLWDSSLEFPKGIDLSLVISHSDGNPNRAPREGTRPTSPQLHSCRPRALTRRSGV